MLATNDSRIGFTFLLPALAFVAVFVLYPVAQLFLLSLTNESLLGGGRFVGLENYRRAVTDPIFRQSLWFTIRYTAIITPILVVVGFALALLVSTNTPLLRFARTVLFLPVVIGLASSSLLWVWLFNEQVGLFNRLLVDIGILDEPIVWFRDVDLAMFAIILAVVWKMIGFGMIIMVGGIQSVRHDVLEAAKIDGATYLQRVVRVILPLSSRAILLASLVSAIGSMLAFDQFYLMTGGAPRGQTITSVYWIYQNSFVYFELGYGGALSILLMLLIMAAAATQIWLQRRAGA